MTVATSMFRSRGLDLRAFQTPASCRAGSFHPALTARVQKSTAYSARSLVDHKQLVVPEWFGWSNTTLKLSSSSSYIRFPRSVQALINWSQVSALPLSRPIKRFTRAAWLAKERGHCSNTSLHWSRNPLQPPGTPSSKGLGLQVHPHIHFSFSPFSMRKR